MTYVSGAQVFRGRTATLKASAAETANATHATLDTGEAANLAVTVAVTAASGTTPTLVVIVEGSIDGTNWIELGRIGANGYRTGNTATAPSNFTGAGTVAGVFPAPQFVRTRSTVGGTTPSFTYSVTAEVGG